MAKTVRLTTAQAIVRYLQARFGPGTFGAIERAELRRRVTAARRALRRR